MPHPQPNPYAPPPRMSLVLCMAGLYQRFRDRGYATPKFLLPWHGTPLLEHILSHMLDPRAFRTLVCIANARDEPHAPALHAILARFGVPNENLRFVSDTKGQADTARIGAKALAALHPSRSSSPVVFHNIDTVLVGRDYRAIAHALATHAGYIDTFDATSPAYSYVALDAMSRVTRIKEKVVISRHATTGLYGFASADAYIAWADRVEAGRGPRVLSGELNKEFYISEIYQAMIDAGESVVAWGGAEDIPGRHAREPERTLTAPRGPASERERHSVSTMILGTPEEYEAARAIQAPPGPFAPSAPHHAVPQA